MRIVSIDSSYLAVCTDDSELMLKSGRPCVVVLKLGFRGKRYDFAVPFRSNIAPNVPKSQYFTLPPRPTTKPKYRHGIHYIKMFPITSQYQVRFRTAGNSYYETVQNIVDSHTSQIVGACQDYLDEYESNGRPRFATDLDYLLKALGLV